MRRCCGLLFCRGHYLRSSPDYVSDLGGWSTLVAAELIAATRGFGFMVQSAGEFLATDVVLAGIAVIAVIAFI